VKPFRGKPEKPERSNVEIQRAIVKPSDVSPGDGGPSPGKPGTGSSRTGCASVTTACTSPFVGRRDPLGAGLRPAREPVGAATDKTVVVIPADRRGVPTGPLDGTFGAVGPPYGVRPVASAAKFRQNGHMCRHWNRPAAGDGVLGQTQDTLVGCGERAEIGRIRKADRTAATPVERYDPEGAKIPEGEWRRGERPDEFAAGSATGLRRGSGRDWGKPVPAAEPKDRTGIRAGKQASEVAGRDQ